METPTAEAGIPYKHDGGWFALFGPKGLPQAIVSRLTNALRAILSAPEVVQRLASQGIDAGYLGPDALATFQQQEIVRWAAEIRRFGIKAD